MKLRSRSNRPLSTKIHAGPHTQIYIAMSKQSSCLMSPTLPVLPSLRELTQQMPTFSTSRELTRRKSLAVKKALTLEELNRRRRIKYGVGCCSGVALVFGAKKLLGRLPIIGPFLAPILSLVPTVLTGVVIGSAVVYGLEEGDLA